MSTLPRAKPLVLLVDDDAAIRRLVALVLEDEPLELISCASADAALARLAQGPVDLLITDLMMPGLSGFDLLERLQAQPALRGGARLLAFSAGLTPERAQRLHALGVEALLDKPVAVSVLLANVQRALGAGATAVPEPRAAAVAVPPAFGGDTGLYKAFREACLQQYGSDVRDGDAALSSGDAAALRRIAHNLKGSLRTLGEERAAEVALALEQAVLQTESAARWPALWAELKLALTQIP